MAAVKQEKDDTETALNNVRVEKQAVEANLEEATDNLEDAQELSDQLALLTDIWQGHFDELVALVESGEADTSRIKAIKERSMASGR